MMSGRKRIDVPKRLEKYSVPTVQSFVPKSTISSARERAELLKMGKRDAVQETKNEPEVDEPKLDIFGLRRTSNFEDEEDDQEEVGGNAHSFWMPDASVPAEKPQSSGTMTTGEGRREEKNKPREIFDGYHIWHEWMSRTANKPFWHCKETGETRWEPPKRQAVQDQDRAPTTNPGKEAGEGASANLLDGELDEEANRRAFLQALYAWRNGEDVAEEAGGGGQEKLATPAVAPRTTAEKVRLASSPPAADSTTPKPLPSRPVPLTASLHAAASKGQVEMLRDILSHADAEERDRFGSTALHYAAGGGHLDAVKLLLGRGAKINSQNHDGDSPLHLAAKGSSFNVLVELLEYGADMSLKNKRGNDAATIARMFGRRDFDTLLSARATRSGDSGGGGRRGVEKGQQAHADSASPRTEKEAAEEGAAADEVDEDDLASARRQLEALRMRAKEEVEHRYSSRPSTAASST
uniref:WW domain-containing protein n=1 Tax=Guillardia theta TaxID=55529 RepID=A0A6U6AK40_GUITH|mmetsp:Transcript_31892/g.101729  ORF Transcript_31892/g.101729 Transcript_31892/m.101729 type:complete len:466 (+) Transcript_31892:74-1471(+)